MFQLSFTVVIAQMIDMYISVHVPRILRNEEGQMALLSSVLFSLRLLVYWTI
jgi:hypothetical protein